MSMDGAFLLEVSRRIKERRLHKRMTLQELADKTNVTKGLISQIENNRSVPSLPVLFNIIKSLELEVGDFFEGLKFREPLILIRRQEDYESFEKENTKGFSYQRVLENVLPASTVDVLLLELHPDSYREEVLTNALKYKYILSGEVEYLINGKSFTLKAGDSLFFDGRLSHVPKNRTKESCRMLIVHFYNQK
ncbi:XRE family transcriptional regulator [Siphonobacter sp. SORGH_AS_0500]|uniref:helix-turn-helix domain-containing protein n=2 Tax=unclassified Siphonobacter TaxID=2635712 RepID=UPI00285EC0E4|nr:XRE family transcriptional regulator [Siphonobacter sp. SORGH_AS_0500]MDR6197707.1 transcriptional regulator with XRE-family HTH domain [Siphonobacter sp. SORGH_AS_0500]